jgi:hypothetical protein
MAIWAMTLIVIYSQAVRSPSVGGYHDDGVYAVTAKSLAEGKGYRIISLPDAPFQTKYPILFPYLLSWIWKLAPQWPANVPYLKMVPLVSGVGWLWTSWLLIRRCGMPRAALTMMLIALAASPWIIFLSTSLMSETLFALLMTATILMLYEPKPKGSASRAACLAGILAGSSLLVRATGVPVVVAGLLYLLSQHRWKDLNYFAVSAILVSLPWLVWVSNHSQVLGASDSYYAATNYGSWNVLTNYTFAEKLRVVSENIIWLGIAPIQILGVKLPMRALPAIFLGALLVRGLWIERRHPITVFVVIYFATIACWAWPPLRFVVVVSPMVGWLIWTALPKAPRIQQGLVVGMLLAMSPILWRMPAEIRNRGASWPAVETGEDWKRTDEIFDWLRRETPESSVLCGNLDPMFYLYTGRQAVRAFETDALQLYYHGDSHSQPIGTAETLRQRIVARRVDFLVMMPNMGFGESLHLRHVVDQFRGVWPRSLVAVAGEANSRYVIYRVDRSRLESPAR